MLITWQSAIAGVLSATRPAALPGHGYAADMKRLISTIAATACLLSILAIIFAADHASLPSTFKAMYAFPGGDKLAHVGLTGLLAFALACAVWQWRRRRRFVLLVAGILLCMMTLEEASQMWIPARTPDVGDLLANMLGISLGAGAVLAYIRHHANRDSGKRHATLGK